MANEASQSLLQRMKTTPLRGVEGKVLLRRLLESMALGAGDTHLLAARAIFAAAEAAAIPEKIYLLDQLYFCLARALEDYAMCCLMTWDESRHALDIYLNMDRPELRAFYSRCRKNLLTAEQLFKVSGVTDSATHKRLGIYKLDFSNYEAALDWAARDVRERLSLFGRLYHSTLEEADPLLGPWQIAYAKAPIGLKLLVDRQSGAAEILMGAEEVADPLDPKKKLAGAFSVKVLLENDFAENVLRYLDEVCVELRRRAALKLAMMDGVQPGLDMIQSQYKDYLQNLSKAKKAVEGAANPMSGASLPMTPSVAPETVIPAEAAEEGPKRLKIYHSYISSSKKPAEEAPPKKREPRGSDLPYALEEAPEPSAPEPKQEAAPEAHPDSPTHIPGEMRQVGEIKIIHSKDDK